MLNSNSCPKKLSYQCKFVLLYIRISTLYCILGFLSILSCRFWKNTDSFEGNEYGSIFKIIYSIGIPIQSFTLIRQFLKIFNILCSYTKKKHLCETKSVSKEPETINSQWSSFGLQRKETTVQSNAELFRSPTVLNGDYFNVSVHRILLSKFWNIYNTTARF